MRLRINQISVKLNYEKPDALAAIARLLNCHEDDLDRLVLLRRSIDARGVDVPPRRSRRGVLIWPLSQNRCR